MKRVFSFVYGPNSHAAGVSVLFLLSLLITHGCYANASNQKKDVDKPEPLTVHQESDHDMKKSNLKAQAGKFECTEEDKACEKDRLGLEAIKTLHLLLDDDHNGNVDQSESDEFLRDELQYTDGFERQALFHNNDKLISVDDLWRTWKHSVVYNWTVDDVIEWLVEDVDLPQYSHAFHRLAIDGSYLPRLVNSTGPLLATIGIRSPVHKQKLSLKAMDAVLFGAPKRIHSYAKDVLLVSSLLIIFGGGWFTYLQHRYSKTQYKKMLHDLESLQKAEEALKKLSKELSDAEKNQKSIPPEKQEELMLLRKSSLRLKIPNVKRVNGDSSPSLSRESSLVRRQEGERKLKQAEEELASLREALNEAENRLEVQQQLEAQWSVPGELQAWLQMTYEMELQHHNTKHQAAGRQLAAARDGCDKIKKRNKAFFGSLRMAHSNSMDDIDQSLLDARAALEEVKQDLQERLNRWHTIEMLCAFPIINNPGLSNLRQMLGRESPNGSTSRSIAGTGLPPVSIEEADEDLPSVAFMGSIQNGASSSNTRPRASSTGYPALAPSAQKSYQTLTGSTGSLSHVGKAPSPCQSASVRRENLESNLTPSSALAAPTSSVSFHLGEGPTAHHERSHSNASSAHPASSVTNGHSSTHQYYPHQGQGHAQPRQGLAGYHQSYSYPPLKQSSTLTLQAPGSHLSSTSSVGTLSKVPSSHGNSFVSLRPGLSSSNSNLSSMGQKVHHHHSHEDPSLQGQPLVAPLGSGVSRSPQLSNAHAHQAPSHGGYDASNESWEMESTDSLHQQMNTSSERPQLQRSLEFDETGSVETTSLQSASALATKIEKKPSKKKKYLPNFLKKTSAKQKTS